MTQKQILEAILDKTMHIRGGLTAQDMDIVENALGERENLIASYLKSNFGPIPSDCIRLASRATEMDMENSRLMKVAMDECNEKVMEARRKIKELQTGKKATAQYHGTAVANKVSAFDFKR